MLITFDSTHKAIHFERLLMSHFAIELIPTPREITASCGLSLKFEVDDLQAVKKDLEDEPLNGIGLYQYFKNGRTGRAVELNWR
jgi:hypothetical protein